MNKQRFLIMMWLIISLIGSGWQGRVETASAAQTRPNASTPVLVKDIYPGIGGGMPESISIAALGNSVFFNGRDPALGEELWTSDGTLVRHAAGEGYQPGRAWIGPRQPAGLQREGVFQSGYGDERG